jgi:multidrug transporter EmrE-like cation transporter
MYPSGVARRRTSASAPARPAGALAVLLAPAKALTLTLLATGGVVLTLGDLVMKEWVVTRRSYLYVAGMLVYLVGLNFLAQSYRFENMAAASAMLVVFNVVSLAVVSWLYFDEKLSGLQVVGIALALLAVVLIERGGR